MPWSLVQPRNSGVFTGTTGGTVTLSSGTIAGSAILIVFATNASTLTPPAGFTRDSPNPTSAPRLFVYRKTATAGETSWAFSQSAAVACTWDVYEVDGLDTSAPVDSTPSAISTTAAAGVLDTWTTGTNVASSVYDGLVIAVHTADNTASATIPAWSGHTQGLVEDIDHGVAVGSTAIGTSVSLASVTGPQLWEVAATSSVTASTLFAATHVVYACSGTHRAPMYDVMCGFEFGTAAGLGTTSAQNPFDVITGTPAVVSTNPRTGSWCLELSTVTAIENVQWLSGGALGLYGSAATPPTLVYRFGVTLPNPLPSGDTDLFRLDGGAGGNGIVVRYVSASQKIGVQVGAGTQQLSAATVAADIWYGIDIRGFASTTVAFADWQLDGVDQTQATGTTATGSHAITYFGWLTSTTATVRIDDIIGSKTAGQYPIGNVKIYPLLPVATLTASTTADFQTFTANGTTAAWNAATALTAIDEIPPTIGASADGVVQAVSSATDFVEVPMQTRNAALNGEVIRAVRWYFPGWAASTTAATIGFRGFDGTAETILWAAADPNFDNSTTVPGWVCRMHRTLGASSGPKVITQAQLDALTARIGFGNAAVKVGVHAVLAEVAMRVDPLTVRVAEVTGLEGVTSTAFVDARLDADSGAVIAYDATPAPDFAASVSYTERGTPTTTALPAGNPVATEIVGADTIDDVTNLSIGQA